MSTFTTLATRESKEPPATAVSGDWRASAQCRLAEPDEFFPETDKPAIYAKGFCRSCRVREACLVEAILTQEENGIWGGMSPRDRRAIVRSTRIGTDAEGVAAKASISVENARRIAAAFAPDRVRA